MSEIKSDLLYAQGHEWVRDNQDGTYTMGISDHAQAELGDMVFVELPSPGDSFSGGDNVAVVESVKAASDVYAPCDLEIVAVNEQLDASPDLINSDCYDDGYLLTFKADDLAAAGLMDASAYEAFLDNE